MTAGRSHQRREVEAEAISDQLKSRPIDARQVLSGLSDSDTKAVIKMTEDRSYARGSYIYELGEHQQGFYALKTGLIEEFRLSESGVKLPMGRIMPGQLFGFSSVEKHYCCFAEALEESAVGFLSFEKLEDICRDFPTIACNMVKALAWRLGEFEERLELMAFGGLRVRVAWTLLGLFAVHGPILFNTTHETLAAWAAGSRPKVSQILEELQRAGILRLSRGEIHIRDSKRLAEWAKQVSSLPSEDDPLKR